MLEILREILTSPVGSVVQIVLLFVLVIGLVWKVSHFNTKFNDLDKIDTKFNSLEDKFEKKFDRVDNKMDEIKQSLITIKGFFDTLQNTNNPLAQRQSPVSLTDKGKEVAEAINLKELVDNHWKYLSDKFDELLPKRNNPYDIQVASFTIGDLFIEFLTEEELNAVKTDAFKRGYDISLYEILFGIEIRDRILKKRGISVSEIDAYDPKKKKDEIE